MEITNPLESLHLQLPIKSVLEGALLLYVASKIQIPFYPVAFTGHTLVLFILGLTKTPKTAFFSALIYICFGANLTGVTAGYLFAMPLAAYLVSCMKKTPLKALIFAQALIYVLGVINLSFYIGCEKALIFGCLIFLPVAFIKIAMALSFAHYWKNL